MSGIVNLYRDFFKRALDATSAALLLVALAPLLLLIALLVAVNLGQPVLFRQVRPGRNGKLFTILKFRTMRAADDAEGRPLPDEKRLTRFGKLLRSSSLDELPELMNVLLGDMSLVGPRPLIIAYLERYTPEQARRHELRPGITGLAQVSGRNTLAWDERFKLDVQYVDSVSLALDLKILWLTFVAVLRRDGISAEGHATMPEFRGPGPKP